MAQSLVGGLLSSGFTAENVRAFDPDPAALKKISSLGSISIQDNSYDAATGADVILLAVKPQVVQEACEGVRVCVEEKNVILITIAAGISASVINSYFDGECKIVRCMPNTPALIGWGASGLFATCNVSKDEKLLVESIFSSVGKAFWVETESDIDIVTALSGSGPAYFFLFMEYLVDVACELGLDRQTAISLTKQTAAGAAHMMLENNNADMKELRKAVTSPGGTTEQAIKAFVENGFHKSVNLALAAAHNRALQLANDFKTN